MYFLETYENETINQVWSQSPEHKFLGLVFVSCLVQRWVSRLAYES